jgi:hypothetical protein
MIRRFFTFLAVTLFICVYSSDAKSEAPQNNKEISGGQVPKITASVDRARAHVGDLINLTLKFSIPEGSVFTPDTDLTGLDVLTITGKKSSKGEIILTIIIDKPASFDIGPVGLSFKDSKGVLTIIRSDALRIEVLSNLGDKPAEAELKPIMDIIPTYPVILKLLPWIIAVLVLAAGGAGFYFWKKRKREKDEALMDVKPAHVVAKEEIEKLKAMYLIDKGEYKEFYFRFSEILRQYIERLRGFPAAELTTEEIGRRIKYEGDRKLVPILREADLVKFADAIPSKAMNDEHIKAALEYIRTTTPAEMTHPLTPSLLRKEGEKAVFLPFSCFKRRGRGMSSNSYFSMSQPWGPGEGISPVYFGKY